MLPENGPTEVLVLVQCRFRRVCPHWVGWPKSSDSFAFSRSVQSRCGDTIWICARSMTDWMKVVSG